MSLAIVIPVWNDADGVARLIDQTAGMGFVSEVIVVDDASDPPCDPAVICAGPPPAKLRYVRVPENRGAGHARNVGRDAVTAPYTLFFDSDDLFLPEFEDLFGRLDGRDDFDFCIFKHMDSRVRAQGGTGPLAGDERRWQSAGAVGVLGELTLPQAVKLSTIAAYPWNKVYRTGFLRQSGIGCTEISIHNDLEIHWTSFLKARRMLYSDLICCEHFVAEGKSRLTNKSGAERLEVVEAFRGVLRTFDDTPEAAPYLPEFLGFAVGLFGWIRHNIVPDLHDALTSLEKDFLRNDLSVEQYVRGTLENPALGSRINQMISGRVA